MIRLLTLVGTVLVSALAGPAIAGCFPARPASVRLHKFTGVLSYYGVGNDQGGFSLIIGGKVMFFSTAGMTINGEVLTCRDPSLYPDSFSCPYWPPSIVLGKSVVTATCWTEKTQTLVQTEGPSCANRAPVLWFCDEIDSGRRPRPRRFAEWWALKKDGGCDNDFPSPVSVYEEAKKAGFAPQIEDFGDGEVVVHMILDEAPVQWTYFNTLQACQKRQDAIANGTFSSDKEMLKKYR